MNDAERKRAARQAKGAVSRAEYEDGSIAAQARAIGVAPATLRQRMRRAKAKAALFPAERLRTHM